MTGTRQRESLNGRAIAELSTGKNASVAFPLWPFGNIRLQPERRNYLVKGLLANTGLAVIWGPPKCGKSFWAADLGMHIALGWDYRGHKVQQAPVVYVALEGRHGFPARIEALRRHYGVDSAPFYLLTTTWSQNPANSSQPSKLNSEKIFRARFSWTLSTAVSSGRNRKTRTWLAIWPRLREWLRS
jgi:hypothetical protein